MTVTLTDSIIHKERILITNLCKKHNLQSNVENFHNQLSKKLIFISYDSNTIYIITKTGYVYVKKEGKKTYTINPRVKGMMVINHGNNNFSSKWGCYTLAYPNIESALDRLDSYITKKSKN